MVYKSSTLAHVHDHILSASTVNMVIGESSETVRDTQTEIPRSSHTDESLSQPPKVLTFLAAHQRPRRGFEVGRVGNGTRSFDGLVSEIRTHPAFASLVHTTFLECTGAPSIVQSDDVAENFPIGGAQQGNLNDDFSVRGSSLDIHISALAKAMKVMRKYPSPLISDTIAACQESIRSNTKPSDTLRVGLDADAKRVLDAWFNVHFDNPYPSNEEKKKLMKLCGIRRSQLNNYFGNRRLRVKQEIFRTKFRGDVAFLSPPGARWSETVLARNKKSEGLTPRDPPHSLSCTHHRLLQMEERSRRPGRATIEFPKYISERADHASDSLDGQERCTP